MFHFAKIKGIAWDYHQILDESNQDPGPESDKDLNDKKFIEKIISNDNLIYSISFL